MIDVNGKNALVTAGSRGLGAEIVKQLASQGADVAFTYKNDEGAALDLQNEIERMGRRCKAFRADASDFRLAHEVVEAVQKIFGKIDILVCNAGIAKGAPLWKMTEDDWDIVIAVTLKGAFNYIRAVSHYFIEQNYGKIICIGSINGLRGRVGSIGYNTAKAGLSGVVKTAASELGKYNVNINLVAPGYIETPSQETTPELIKDIVLQECVIKRLGLPKDIAPLVVFLASEAAGHITGQTIKIDAGQYL